MEPLNEHDSGKEDGGDIAKDVQSDSDDEAPIGIQKKKKSMAVLDDSDDDEDQLDNDEQKEPNVDSETVSGKSVVNSDDESSMSTNLSDNKDEDEARRNVDPSEAESMETGSANEPTTEVQKEKSLLQNDLFDAEMDSDADDSDNEKRQDDSSDSDNERSESDENESLPGSRKQNSDSESDGAENDEENNERKSDAGSDASDGDEPSEMSAALKRRLKKGAGKKSSSSSSSQRPPRESIQEIHSESQRLVRESSVRLPYHEPEKEKVGLSVFLARCKQKQEELESVKKGASWRATPEPSQSTQPKVSTLPRAAQRQKIPSLSPSRLAQTVSKPSGASKSAQSAAEDVDSVKKNISKELADTEEDWDTLPDLIMEKETTTVQYEVLTAEEAQDSEEGAQDKAPKVIQEQESGYVSVPTSEEENSGDKNLDMKSLDDDNDKDIAITKRINDCDISDDLLSRITDKYSIPSLKTSDEKSLLTPKIGSVQVNTFTPKLSGGPDSFIDFDMDDDDTTLTDVSQKTSSGIDHLMERVLKHSAKRPTKKAHDVEISTVTKETCNNQEELKLQKLTYHVDEEVEESESKTPGAKLLMLKEKLQSKIKQKRQEARKEREKIHALDNEESYREDAEEILDEEAELTDESESEEEDIVDEEDLIGGHEDIEEEEEDEEEENNPFVDKEAEEEDDEEDMEEVEESNLHLKLDVADGDDESRDVTEPRKDFLQAALKKTKTLDLFDEDANTESPTMSQNSNGCSAEVSSRPFQQLSGESAKAIDGDDDMLSPENGDDEILLLDTQPIKNSEVSSLQCLSRDKDTSLLSADSSFEMMGSYISAGQRTSKKHKSRDVTTPDLLTPSSKSSATNSTLTKTASRMSDSTLAIDDTQDLLAGDNSNRSVKIPQSQKSPSFDFHIEETQSLMLDDEGLFKVRSESKPIRRQLLLDNSTMGSGSHDDILGLCSGKFTEGWKEDSQQTDKESHATDASKSMFGDSQHSMLSNTQNMDELLGLCSGRFTTQATQSRPPPTLRQQLAEQDDDKESLKSLQPGTGPFVVAGSLNGNTQVSPSKDSDEKKKRKRAVIDDDDSNDSFELAPEGGEDCDKVASETLESDEDIREGEDEEERLQLPSDDEEMQLAKKFRGFTSGKKHGKIRREFIDQEAELSGSEYDSDENYDIAERDDVLELEDGDMDDVGTEDDLRNQVGRVHLKSVIDADKKELRLFQEMYLQDGDMHSEGAGRQRKFRWRNIDDTDTQQDLFNKSDDEDADEGHGGDDENWRVKRYEREKYLNEQKENEAKDDSDVIKLGKIVFKAKKDKTNNKATKAITSPKDVTAVKDVGKTKENFAKPKLPAHGSFLKRSKDSLAKLAEMTKPIAAVGGARNSGKFVFSAVSPDPKEKEPKRPQVKRSISSSQQPTKRPRLERSNTLPDNSIFKLM